MSVQEIRKAVHELKRLEYVFFHMVKHGSEWGTPVMCAHFAETWLNDLPRVARKVYAVSKAKTEVKSFNGNFKGFVNYVLSEADKAEYKKWDVDDHDLWLAMSSDLMSGYKLSVSYNKQNDTFTATYMCNDTDSPNVGYCLSAFAPDWYNAVRSLVFKHNIVLDCVWNLDKAKDQNSWG